MERLTIVGDTKAQIGPSTQRRCLFGLFAPGVKSGVFFLTGDENEEVVVF